MEANDASLVSGDATSRAQELRASLGARQTAEALLAEAGLVRQEAASAADAMVAEAQQLSEQLAAESRQAGEQITAEAREQAEGVLARARLEAEEVAGRGRATADALRAAAETEIEEHRRRVRAEVTAQVTHELTEQHRIAEATAREQSEALISDLEASVRILGVSLESALANVSELLGSLEALRPTSDASPSSTTTASTTGSTTESTTGSTTESTTASTNVTAPRVDAPQEPDPPSARTGGAHLVDTPFGLEPKAASTSSVPSATSPFGTEVDDEVAADASRPRSATEAFLSSSSMEIEQASQELRDLQHPEDARRRRGDESRRAAQRRELDAGAPGDDDEEPESTDESARPLGWLFRTAQ